MRKCCARATNAELEVLQTIVTDDSVLQLERTVGEFHIDLTIPVASDLSLHGETCAADAGTIANRIGPKL